MPEFRAESFPLDELQIICDECLGICKVKRGGSTYDVVYILECLCGKREMVPYGWSFRVDTTRTKKVLASSFLHVSQRTYRIYDSSGNNDWARLLIEYDTGVYIEDDKDIDLFRWATHNGKLPYTALEDASLRLMNLYKTFKDVPGGPEPVVYEKEDGSQG